jgi:hypothetical protein
MCAMMNQFYWGIGMCHDVFIINLRLKAYETYSRMLLLVLFMLYNDDCYCYQSDD